MKRLIPCTVLLVMAAAMGFFFLLPSAGAEEVAAFPLNSMDGVITRDGVSFDPAISSDGKGSLRIDAAGPRVVRLFEVTGLDIDNARLIYQARIRTKDVKGQVYLEMWLRFPGKGEFFSRGLQDALSGTNEWSSVETPFFLKKGEKPDLAKLNVVIKGAGTVWIDDVKLFKSPLK